MGLVFPCCLHLLYVLHHFKPKPGFRVEMKSTRRFLQMLAAVSSILVVQVTFDHIPLQFQKYQQAGGEGRRYLPVFWEGISHSIFARVVDQGYDKWIKELGWMGGYFTGAVWFTLYMAMGPRFVPKADKVQKSKSRSSSILSMASKKSK